MRSGRRLLSGLNVNHTNGTVSYCRILLPCVQIWAKKKDREIICGHSQSAELPKLVWELMATRQQGSAPEKGEQSSRQCRSLPPPSANQTVASQEGFTVKMFFSFLQQPTRSCILPTSWKLYSSTAWRRFTKLLIMFKQAARLHSWKVWKAKRENRRDDCFTSWLTFESELQVFQYNLIG